MTSQALRVRGPLLKLGVFTLVTLAATYLLAATIANRGFGRTTSYRAELSDVTGLVAGDDVRIAGVRVGQVSGVRIARRTVAEVGFTVDAGQPLPTGTLAQVRYRNLVGQRYLALTPGPGDVRSTLPAGGLIPLAHTQPALDLTALFGGFKPLFAALDPAEVNKLAYEIIQTLQGEGGTVESLLAHTASLTTAVADRDEVIGRTVDNLNAVLGTVSQRDQKLTELIVRLQTFVSGLAADRKAIGDSLTSIDGLARSTAGLLAKGRPDLQADLTLVQQLARNLNADQGAVEGAIHNLPTKLNAIIRTATYGSWFNFYLCGLTATVRIGQVTIPYTPQVIINQARCRP
ncbi:MAG TPA: MCE family protein [Mycobacteriales bacterium]|nr:MCE family protein [Mycobacteriales bacterium]